MINFGKTIQKHSNKFYWLFMIICTIKIIINLLTIPQ